MDVTPPHNPPTRIESVGHGQSLELTEGAFRVRACSPFGFMCFVDRWSADDELCELWELVSRGRKPSRQTVEGLFEDLLPVASPELVAELLFEAGLLSDFAAYVVDHDRARTHIFGLPRYNASAVSAQELARSAMAKASADQVIREIILLTKR